MKQWSRFDCVVIFQACYGFTLQFSHHLPARVGGYNHTHVHSCIICSWMWNQPQTAQIYTRPQCECSCLESPVITAIRVATTASQVRSAITSPRSSPLTALFSSNLLLTEWLADKWRFLFLAWGLHRVWQRRRRTPQRNVWKLLLASSFFFPPAAASCTIYTLVSHSFHLRKGEKTEFTLKKRCVGRKRRDEGQKRCNEMFRMSRQKVKRKQVPLSLQQPTFSHSVRSN